AWKGPKWVGVLGVLEVPRVPAPLPARRAGATAPLVRKRSHRRRGGNSVDGGLTAADRSGRVYRIIMAGFIMARAARIDKSCLCVSLPCISAILPISLSLWLWTMQPHSHWAILARIISPGLDNPPS